MFVIGIFVIEAKNMGGWIFGDVRQAQWTQSLWGKKFRFQNPLHQNYRHTRAISEFLNIDHDKLISIVMFWGECEFKTQLPSNVLNKGYIAYIKRHTMVRFTDAEVQSIVLALQTGRLPPSWATRRQHIANLKDRHQSRDSNTVRRSAPEAAHPERHF